MHELKFKIYVLHLSAKLAKHKLLSLRISAHGILSFSLKQPMAFDTDPSL